MKIDKGGDKVALRTDASALRQAFVLKNRNGLHARPCALLVRTLRPFQCQIEVRANSEVANGRSIMGLMALAAGYEMEITFIISGKDSAKAMAAVRHLFETRFEEAYE